MLALVMTAMSCVNRVTPPARPDEPITVILLDHGRHPSLMLPRDRNEETWGRYSYGEWRWYAEGRGNVFGAFSAMLWPTRGALGRQLLHADQSVQVHFVRMHPIEVSSKRAHRLAQKLDAVFEADGREPRHNPDFHAEFVPHPRAYSIFNQSNKVMADWLQELDCEVRGPVLYSKWRIVK